MTDRASPGDREDDEVTVGRRVDPGTSSEPTVRWVGLVGARIAYLESGAATGPPVVVLPGLTDGLGPVTRADRAELLRELPLPRERLRTLVLSYREDLTQDTTTRQLAADAAAAIERLVDRPVVLVCHSMGGMVAQHLAADRPDLVAGLVLSSTCAHSDDRVRRVFARWDTLVAGHRFDELAREGVEISFTGEDLREARRALATEPPSPEPVDLVPRHLALSRAAATHDARDRLAAIVAPTLVMTGDEDAVIPVDLVRELVGDLAHAELEVLPGLGHGFPGQVPELMADLVGRFLTSRCGIG